MEVVDVARFLADRDYINRDTTRRPHIVEIDPSGHNPNQHIVGAEFRNSDHFRLKGGSGITESLTANNLCVHLVWYLTHRRQLANINKPTHSPPPANQDRTSKSTRIILNNILPPSHPGQKDPTPTQPSAHNATYVPHLGAHNACRLKA